MRVLHLANMQMNSASDRMNIEKMKELLQNPYNSADKGNSPLITHSSCESKSKEHILAHNQMEILSVDIDDGVYRSIVQVSDDLKQLNVKSYCVYTTASHNPSEGKFKFRAIIPLAKSITCEEFTITQLALARLFKADDVVARIQQILYLPKTGDSYEYIDSINDELFDVEQSPTLMETIVQIKTEKDIEEKQKEAEQLLVIQQRAARKAQIESRGGEQLESVFELTEQSFTMEELLLQYGFKKKGSRYLHPNSGSGLAGVMILDGRYFSHHSEATDELANGKSHSCFDLIKYWEYGNNQEKAIEGLSKELMVGSVSLYEHNESIKKNNVESEIKKHNKEMHETLKAIEDLAHHKAESLALSRSLHSEDFEPTLEVDKDDDEEFHQAQKDQAVAEATQTKAITELNVDSIEIDVDSDEIINFDARSNIMPTKKMQFDLLKPKGLVSRIIEEICIRMRRSDPALAVAPALYIAMRAGLPSIENSRLNENYDIRKYGVGLDGFKIYLNMLSIGISASGKDKPQQLLNHTLNYLGDDVYGRVASDKDLAISLIDSIGSTCLVLDEAGGLFSNMKDSGAASYMKNLAGTMMSYATAEHINFDGLIKRGLRNDYLVNLHKLNKSLDNIDEEDPEKEKRIRANIEREIEQVQWRVDACQNGVEMPQFAIMATSTPSDMKGAISLQTLNTGQMSRYLMFVGKSDVDILREKVEGINYRSLSDELLAKLTWIKTNAHLADEYALMANAKNTYSYIQKWFESRRNHSEFSVLYRRGFETVVRLSSILAFEDRIVTVDHLEWAFCVVRANIESFVMTCALEDEKATDGDKLAIEIVKALKSNENGLYHSMLKQRFARKAEWAQVIPMFDNIVDSLVEKGYVIQDGKRLAFSGKNSIDKV